MQKEIKQTCFFTQPPHEVWEYLTKADLIEQWLMKTDFQPIVGHKCTVTSKSGKVTYCEVLESIPNQLLSYTWRVQNPGGEITVDSKVTWTLSEKDGGTELQLHHGDFMRLEDYTAHNTGWNTCLKQLEELLKTN